MHLNLPWLLVGAVLGAVSTRALLYGVIDPILDRRRGRRNRTKGTS